MRKLRRAAKSPGRAAVVVPNGTLFGDGVCGADQARAADAVQPAHRRPPAERGVRPVHAHPDEHAVLRPVRADGWRVVLRAAAAGRPQEVHQDGPAASSRSSPTAWRGGATGPKGERAWKVPAADLIAAGCNLDRKNPNAQPDAAHLPPEELVESILAKEARIAAIVGEIKALLAGPITPVG